jgi:TonB family protein
MIKATLLLLFAGCVIPRLRHRSAAERHLLWATSLAAATLLPLLTLALPAWQPGWMSGVMAALPSSFDPGQPTAGPQADVVVRAIGIESTGWVPGDVLAALWAIGIAVSMLRLGIDAMQLARLAHEAGPASERRSRLVGDIARALHVRRPVELLQSSRGLIPVTWGIRRPRILLPACADDWPDDRTRAVLSHELAHIGRRDWIVHVLAELGCAIYWFNPLFWIAKNHVCRESEHAADDIVLAMGMDGAEYATHLLDIVRAAQAPTMAWTATIAMARPSHLERRFAALLNACANRNSATGRTLAAAVAVTMLIALPLAAIGSSRMDDMNIQIRTSNLPAIMEGATPPRQDRAITSAPRLRVVGLPDNEGGMTRPEIMEYTTPPLYSDEARTRSIEGLVTVGARVEPDGRVSTARVLRGLGAGLDQNAIVALRQWRFRPGTRAGTPVAMNAEIDIEFNLRNDAVNALIANDMATRVGPGVTPPQAIRVISLKSWRRGAPRGTVVLDVVLLEDGRPKIVRILQSLDPELDESAVRQFEQWRFSPAMKNGRPVKVRMNAEVRF